MLQALHAAVMSLAVAACALCLLKLMAVVQFSRSQDLGKLKQTSAVRRGNGDRPSEERTIPLQVLLLPSVAFSLSMKHPHHHAARS